jgi:molybdopterin converting factor small subunit
VSAVEIRAFGHLRKLFEERGWPFPYRINLLRETTAVDLAARLDLSRDQIETVFVNGVARGLHSTVKPGDRVAFVPPGTPGPYRVILGFKNRAVQ